MYKSLGTWLSVNSIAHLSIDFHMYSSSSETSNTYVEKFPEESIERLAVVWSISIRGGVVGNLVCSSNGFEKRHGDVGAR
jgi:hypothetical protein